MKVSGFWKRIKIKIENLPPSGKFILKGARYGGFAGYTLSTLYALPFGALLLLGIALIGLTNTHNDWYVSIVVIGITFLAIWLGFFVAFIIPAYLTGTISGIVTALILYFFNERIELTAFRVIILTTAFWSPLALLRSVLAMPQIQISQDPLFNQWLFLHIPGMIFLAGMGYVGYRLWKDSESLEETAGEDCQ